MKVTELWLMANRLNRPRAVSLLTQSPQAQQSREGGGPRIVKPIAGGTIKFGGRDGGEGKST
ncbi:MAG: hypothetical protein KME35_23980 [Aphanocapsa sp. GSE-SYN-MK-11-07L]|jgi:hypothetical protein|nr:hypothetical protein [Aphanocapsa sp. GSE-SYN-MK-11-07L]